MRKHLRLSLQLTLLFGSAVLIAQTRHITPFTGTWKLNLAKSTFNPGPPFQSFVLTFTPDGTRHLDLIGADGQALEASLPWSDGKEVPVAVARGSMENVTATSRIQGSTFDDTWKENRKIIEKVHAAVSPDRRTLTISVDGSDRQDHSFHNHLIFEKQ